MTYYNEGLYNSLYQKVKEVLPEVNDTAYRKMLDEECKFIEDRRRSKGVRITKSEKKSIADAVLYRCFGWMREGEFKTITPMDVLIYRKIDLFFGSLKCRTIV